MSLSAAADGAKSLAAGAPVLSAGCHSGIGAAQCRAAARIDVLKAARQSVGRAPQNRSIRRAHAHRATNNWTMIPDNWEQLRREWEYSHAVNAVVTFAAFCSVALSSLMTREWTA